MHERFTVVKKGYDKGEVDKYIDDLEMIIKNYKEKDAAIKNAIVNAQIAADNIVNEAEQRTHKVYQEAVDKLNAIYESVLDQKHIVKEFQEAYNTLIGKYVHKFNDQDINVLYAKVDELETFLQDMGAMGESE